MMVKKVKSVQAFAHVLLRVAIYSLLLHTYIKVTLAETLQYKRHTI